MTPAAPKSSHASECLWVIGPGCEAMAAGDRLGDRYEVLAPHICRDTQPEQPPSLPDTLPESVLPYLKAHPYRLHVPGVYDIQPQPQQAPWILLENSPINPRTTQPYPALSESWASATATRQLSWLWQIWQLWEPLQTLGVATSLVHPENLRVEGWRLRLQQLQGDAGNAPTIADLGRCWQSLTELAASPITESLRDLCDALAANTHTPAQITADLNHLLLQQAAQTPIQLQIAGGTSAGPQSDRNEDACYPEGVLPSQPMPRLGIVCDGVGGHEAGEVASQLVTRSLPLQLRSLLSETEQQDTLVPPDVIQQQIEAAIRVVNDLVNRQNDQQQRRDRQRMGTTLVLALVVRQRLRTDRGWAPVEELYLAHVGDSRAYWITPDYCHLLTVDDDIGGREIQAGRQFPSTVRHCPDASALTQAIGTRSADYLTPHIQRFVLDEPGVLLLCSDGLSDYQRVEQAWANYIGLITKNIISLEAAVASWIELANQKNGHDNVSVVLMRCKHLPSEATVAPAGDLSTPDDNLQTPLTEASRALLYGEDEVTEPPPARKVGERQPMPLSGWVLGLMAAVILILAGGIGWWVADRLTPDEPSAPTSTE